MLSTPQTHHRRPIAAWLLFCAALIFVMVVLGGVTRLTRSGLSIVEWDPMMGAIPPLTAGVPVTFRGMAASFTVVTGHRQTGETPVNWAALAQTGGTLVVLMGVAHRGEIADELMAAGMAATTPVAVIHRATTGAQTAQRCVLSELGTTDVRSPATLVIGAVAALDVTATIGNP